MTYSRGDGIVNQPKQLFANCYLEFELAGKREGVVALVSEMGALHVQFHGIPYSKIAGLAGKSVDVWICGRVKVTGRMSKEMNLSSSFYRLNFDVLSDEAKAAIREALSLQSYQAPWARKEERIPAPRIKQPKSIEGVEQPIGSVIARGDRLFDLEVVDYSRDGILLEGRGELFHAWHTGEKIDLSLHTTKNRDITGITGTIVRISEDFDRDQNEAVFRFGIQFARLNEFTRRALHEMVAKAEAVLEAAPMAPIRKAA